jgi:hypothetical protein
VGFAARGLPEISSSTMPRAASCECAWGAPGAPSAPYSSSPLGPGLAGFLVSGGRRRGEVARAFARGLAGVLKGCFEGVF